MSESKPETCPSPESNPKTEPQKDPPSISPSPKIPTDPSPATSTAISIRQQNAEDLLFQFCKTFVQILESTVFQKSEGDEEVDQEADHFDSYSRYASQPNYASLHPHNSSPCFHRQQNNSKSQSHFYKHSQIQSFQSFLVPISDEEFPFEKYFPCEERDSFRDVFVDVAFSLFRSYEYQLLVLVKEGRKICEIADDIVHRMVDHFKESQRGFNPDFIKPEITARYLIGMALEHREPEGIIYNSEWSAVEILENPGIVVVQTEDDRTFYQSHWQKNFVGMKKKIGFKYGFRLNFDFETEDIILTNFEKIPVSAVSPLYLNYTYCLTEPRTFVECRSKLDKELGVEEKMRKYGLLQEMEIKDKVKEFQIKLSIQKQEEEQNSHQVMKQVVNLGERFDKLRSKLTKLEERGVIRKEDVGVTKAALIRSNYNVRFEIKP